MLNGQSEIMLRRLGVMREISLGQKHQYQYTIAAITGVMTRMAPTWALNQYCVDLAYAPKSW